MICCVSGMIGGSYVEWMVGSVGLCACMCSKRLGFRFDALCENVDLRCLDRRL